LPLSYLCGHLRVVVCPGSAWRRERISNLWCCAIALRFVALRSIALCAVALWTVALRLLRVRVCCTGAHRAGSSSRVG
jgi:hypothetical protein